MVMAVRIGYRQVNGFLIVCLYSAPTLTIFAYKSTWWKLTLPESELETFANRIKSTVDQYVNKLFDALANQDEKVFAVQEDSSGSIKLTWSKEAKKGIQIIFGNFTLDPVDINESAGSKTLEQLLYQILGQWDSFQSRCRELEVDNQKLRELGTEAVEKYEKLVADLQKREFTILNKCADLLNEKKRKINTLMTSFQAVDVDLGHMALEKVVSKAHQNADLSTQSSANESSAAVDLEESEDDEDDLLPKVRKTQKLFSARKPRSVSGSSGTMRM